MHPPFGAEIPVAFCILELMKMAFLYLLIIQNGEILNSKYL